MVHGATLEIPIKMNDDEYFATDCTDYHRSMRKSNFTDAASCFSDEGGLQPIRVNFIELKNPLIPSVKICVICGKKKSILLSYLHFL